METDRAVADMNLESLRIMAGDLGWSVYSYDEAQRKVRLTRNTTRIDIWLTKKSTVAVMKKGQPAKYYRYVVESKLDELLDKS